MMMLMPHRSRCPFLNLVILLCVLLVGSVTPQEILTPQPPPQLNGLHLDITILVESFGFVNVQEDESDGGLTYSGFLVDVLKAIALPIRANFTYTFHSPSGFGSKCPQRPAAPYPKAYWHDFGCGEGDVIDSPLLNNYTTDMYVGAFYITPERQRVTQFTIPFYPPTTGTLAMVGTATGIRTFDDYVQQQEQGLQGPACVAANTQYAKFVRKTFPTMKLVEIIPGSPLYPPMVNGTCDVMIVGRPFATSYVFKMSRDGTCKAREDKPIGIIGDPLGFGPNFFGFGLRKTLPVEIVDTLDYWLNYLMTCSPTDECPNDSLAVLYPTNGGGTGRECDYVQFPSTNHGLPPKIVAVIVIAVVALVSALATVVHRIRLRDQQQRFKKRFVQQIARNITIGPSPSCIPVEKLVEEVQHIGNAEGIITKPDLLQWMLDVKLEFISDRDFDALWTAMDPEGKGEVNAIDFFVFLSACGNEFEKVYEEQKHMPKVERLKLAARRLSNINKLGEDGVRLLQLKLDRHGSRRQMQMIDETL